jgi:hypothetical protein
MKKKLTQRNLRKKALKKLKIELVHKKVKIKIIKKIVVI